MSGTGDEGGSAAGLGPLPAGRHGLSREQVEESQRARLLAAIALLVADRGYHATTITEIAKTASVSSRVFYENFESKEECFLAAFDAAFEDLDAKLTEAAAQESDWPHQVIASLRAALEFFADEPVFARAFVIEPPTATPAIVSRFREAVVAGISFLSRGRGERTEATALPESTEDSILGGLVTLVGRAMFEDSEPIEAVLPDMVEFALAPYVGPDQARRLASDNVTR